MAQAQRVPATGPHRLRLHEEGEDGDEDREHK
jgi:hypothetical protein